MFAYENADGEVVYVENIRCLKLLFATIEHKREKYFLKDSDGRLVATVDRTLLDDKTRSKLDSLAEFEPWSQST